MEIGQRFMTQKRKTNISEKLNSEFNKLSIQVSLNGLSFCILNTITDELVFCKKISFKETPKLPTALFNLVKETIEDNDLSSYTYIKVILTHKNEHSTIVPLALFDEKELKSYLKFNIKVLEIDTISYDYIPNTDLVNVYIPYDRISTYLNDVFGQLTNRHYNTLLLQKTLKNTTTITEQPVVHITVDYHFFNIVILKNKKLLFNNTYSYRTKEDFIYYILFSLEQLQLNPESVKIQLSGNITKDDEYYSALYKYIRHIEFSIPKIPFAVFDKQICSEIKDTTLFEALLCE